MKRKIVFIIFMFICLEGAWAEPVKMPVIPKFTKAEVEAIDQETGQRLWRETHTYRVGKDKERTFLLVNIEGDGKYGGADVPTRWKVDSYYYADPYIKPYSSRKEIFSASGSLLMVEVFNYDSVAKTIYFSREDKITKDTYFKTFELKDDVIDRSVLPIALLSYPFSEQRDFTFRYLSDDPRMYKFTMSYAGKEAVKVPTGTFDCNKLELTVNLGALKIFGIFLPDIYYWFSDTQPVKFVKYEGLESGYGSPYVAIQLIDKLEERD